MERQREKKKLTLLGVVHLLELGVQDVVPVLRGDASHHYEEKKKKRKRKRKRKRKC